MARGIPRETQTFIRTRISSIHQLEALLWVRDNQDRPLTPAILAREERLESTMAEDLIAGFAKAGFLSGPDGEGAYRYDPAPPELGAQLDKLAEVYRTYRVSVINFVFSMPSGSVQSFADAFRIRKEEEDDS